MTQPGAQAWATDDVMDRAEAAWRSLACCRPFVDEELVPAVTAALACLGDVMSLACALPVDERRPWLDDLKEIEEMASAIHWHLVAESRANDCT